MLLENCTYPQDTRVRHEANSLSEAGYRVTVICPKKKGQIWTEQVGQVNVYRYPAPPEADGFFGYIAEYGYSLIAATLFSLVAYIRKGFDIIHAHNPPDIFVLIAMFYKLFGKKFVFDHHDLSPEMYFARFDGDGNRLVHKVLLFFESLSCRMADHVIVTNQSYKKLDMQRSGKPESTVTIVRNGPILTDLPNQTGREYKKPSIIGLCYVGDMGHHDGVDYLLRAIYCLIHDFGRSDFHCTLVGDGDAYKSLIALAEKLQINSFLTFIGWVEHSEVNHFLNEADICVAPEPSNSYNDRCTMIKILEYMAFAKPIVAFDLPEHRYSAQGAALYANPNSESDFAKQIQFLIENPDKRPFLGQIGRDRMENELAWVHQKNFLLKAYEQIEQNEY